MTTYEPLDISNLVNADLTLYSNASYYPQNGGLVTVAGIPFQLATGPNGNTSVVQGSWDGIVSDIAIPGASQTFSISLNQFGVTTVDTLINSAFGVAGTNIGSLVFYAQSGATYTYNLIEGDNVRDHNQDGFDNSATDLAGTIEFGPFVRFDMQQIVLPAAFSTDTLVRVDFHSFGQGVNGVPFLAAIDVEAPPQLDHSPQIDVSASTLTGAVFAGLHSIFSNPTESAGGTISFLDADLADRPTASITMQTVVYHDANGSDDTAQLTLGSDHRIRECIPASAQSKQYQYRQDRLGLHDSRQCYQFPCCG